MTSGRSPPIRSFGMRYEWVAIPANEIPRAADPLFQHVVDTYASEVRT
ncbi:hypothetical protein FRUB_08210 [Fimbriiglobus ruber]|uniref:Uncharacterized protein n=1 Tax=Fimbriiglobus ruber TaxID=1908690 RepID=A0A225DHT4_9BACT|nr:hypothetical protein FRUB_08210 [Fimbriiglobus ruber]